jgi:hypothetical protein
MSLLPDDLERGYGDLYRELLPALNRAGMEDLPEAVREFLLTDHEHAVLRALDWLLDGRYADPRATSATAAPTPKTLSDYRQNALANENLLRCALLLHDIAKERGMSGPHPQNCAHVAERVLSKVKGFSTEEQELLVWLVRYHDVLGNIYSGERAPAFLFEILQGLDDAEIARRLRLLQAVVLCDLRGTDPRFVTEEKATFWLDLLDRQRIEQRQTQLFEWRLQRWGGGLYGESRPKRAESLRKHLLQDASAADRERLESVFGQRISYIMYGFYLFTALDSAELATLMEIIARVVDDISPPANVVLDFKTAYRPAELWRSEEDKRTFPKALEHYATQLNQGQLAVTLEVAQRVAATRSGSTKQPAEITLHV